MLDTNGLVRGDANRGQWEMDYNVATGIVCKDSMKVGCEKCLLIDCDFVFILHETMLRTANSRYLGDVSDSRYPYSKYDGDIFITGSSVEISSTVGRSLLYVLLVTQWLNEWFLCFIVGLISARMKYLYGLQIVDPSLLSIIVGEPRFGTNGPLLPGPARSG